MARSSARSASEWSWWSTSMPASPRSFSVASVSAVEHGSAAPSPRVGDHGDAAGGGDERDHLLERGRVAVDVAGLPRAQQRRERLGAVPDHAEPCERVGHVRASRRDRTAGLTAYVVLGDVDAVRAEGGDDGRRARGAPLEDPVELQHQRRVRGVGQVAQQVHAPVAEARADLEARHERDADLVGHLARLRPAGHGVVVGQRDDVEAGGCGLAHQVSGGVGAVAGGGVRVEVDPHVSCSTSAAPGARARSPAPTRSTVSSLKNRPTSAGCSTQRAVSTRSEWPWAKTRVRSCSRARATTRSRRAETSSAVSPPGDGVRPDRPAGHVLADLRGGHALVVAVGPLDEVVVDRGVGEAGQLGRTTRALPRARQDEVELDLGQPGRQRRRALLTGLGERQVGHRGVPTVAAPLRLTVPDHPELGAIGVRATGGHVRESATGAGRGCHDARHDDRRPPPGATGDRRGVRRAGPGVHQPDHAAAPLPGPLGPRRARALGRPADDGAPRRGGVARRRAARPAPRQCRGPPRRAAGRRGVGAR